MNEVRAHLATKVDLTNCDREPIHIPGSIQPGGILLVCGAADFIIAHASANAAELLPGGLDQLIGTRLDVVLGSRLTHDLRNVLTVSTAPNVPGRIFRVPVGSRGREADFSIHTHAGRTLIEIEYCDGEAARFEPIHLVKSMIARIEEARSSDDLVVRAVRLVKALLGFDRVMIYKFLHDGSGQVIAESRRGDLNSFQHQHFPASDIPAQARELYRRNWIRMIADVDYEPVALVPDLDPSGGTIDLSYAGLRSVSPIHIEYLKNMGVGASLSISILIGGELWGLIACHHYSPKRIAPATRIAAELFAQYFSLQLVETERREGFVRISAARNRLDQLVASFPPDGSLSSNLAERFDGLAGLIACDGIGLWVDGAWAGRGHTPPSEDIAALSRFLNSVSDGGVFATHELARRFPPAARFQGEASGVLAVPLSRIPKDYLLFFRREMVQTITWAGDPEKPVNLGPNGARLTPRKSFEIWKEEVVGQSLPWGEAERQIAETLRMSLLEVVLRLGELAAEERRKADFHARLLSDELNHRVKNILALIRSLVSRGRSEDDDLDSYVHGLEGRIKALSSAHDQIVRKGDANSLAALLETELAPYAQDLKTERIALSGPQLFLDARSYAVMALVMHEMVTNSAKYGALSVDRGRLEITWRILEGGPCEISWRESGGPVVDVPTRKGFGSTLIERAIPYDLQGSADVAFRPGGVEARFTIPTKYVRESAPSESKPRRAGEQPGGTTSLPEGLNVLLVEDQMLIALDAETMLRERAGAAVSTVNSAKDALAALAAAAPEAAVLDVNLGDGTSLGVASELLKRGIPFVFATGYNDGGMIPPDFARIPIVNKPYSEEALVAALSKALGASVR